MRKKLLLAIGCLLAALVLLPLGAWAQGPAGGALVTAGVFDSYDLTLARDPLGNIKCDPFGEYTGERGHEKGGELWMLKPGTTDEYIPAEGLLLEVDPGEELTFKVKLAKDQRGDWGEMLGFGEASEWWEVLEWRVNGVVQDGVTDATFTCKAEAGKTLHVGVRLQRRKFAVVVDYKNILPTEKFLSIGRNSNSLERRNDEKYNYIRDESIRSN